MLLCTCIPVMAQNNAIVEKIKQANTGYTSITSDFTQTKHLSFMNEDVFSKGKFFYSKPDRLVMKYEEPEGDLMLINDDQLVMIAAGKRSKASAKINSRVRALKNILSSCLQGDVSKLEGATVSTAETLDSYIITVGLSIRREKSGTINKVVLNYDKSDLTLSTLQMNEVDGSFTLYKLTDKKLNVAVSDEVFKAPRR
jgi:outer membrane lipoprotein carrier protein